MGVDAETMFRRSVGLHQKSERRMPRDAVQGPLAAAAVGLGGLLVLVVIGLLLGGGRPAWWWLAVLIAGAVAAAGLAQMGRALLRPTKRVTCPRCGTAQRVYEDVSALVCPGCHMLLLLGPHPSVLPALSACPYCGLQTAITPDHGPFMCSNCGMLRHSTAPEALGLTRPCPQCEQPVPVGAIYCRACQSILFHDFSRPVEWAPGLAYDLDWKSGQDAAGHFQFARALLLDIEQAEGLDDVRAIGTQLARLMDVLISLEEALQEPRLRPAVEALIPDVDRTYGALLARAAALVSEEAGDPRGLPKGDVDILAAEPHLLARRRVEALLGPAASTSGGIGPWGEHLLVVSFRDRRWDRIRDYRRLVEESARFQAWAEQSMTSRPPAG
jgi:hypothetical protein